jgi:hypothetical protein
MGRYVRIRTLRSYRGSRAIRKANFELRLSFLANYIQTMLNFCLNYYWRAQKSRLNSLTLRFLIARDPLYYSVYLPPLLYATPLPPTSPLCETPFTAALHVTIMQQGW